MKHDKWAKRRDMKYGMRGTRHGTQDMRHGMQDMRCETRHERRETKHDRISTRDTRHKTVTTVTALNFLSSQVGDTIVRKARETLERAIELVNSTAKWGARVVYGDTDR